MINLIKEFGAYFHYWLICFVIVVAVLYSAIPWGVSLPVIGILYLMFDDHKCKTRTIESLRLSVREQNKEIRERDIELHQARKIIAEFREKALHEVS